MDSTVGRPIVAGSDAAVWAAGEVARRHVALRLVTAVHLPVPGYPGGAGLGDGERT